jgi:hypothetical protein
MNASIPTVPPGAVAAYIGIDWADQKHAVALRSATELTKSNMSSLTNGLRL